MGAIPAANITRKETISAGNKRMFICRVTGDVGGGTTLKVPFSTILSAWVGNSCPSGDTGEADGFSPKLSWSGVEITYGAAPTNGSTHMLHVIGSD